MAYNGKDVQVYTSAKPVSSDNPLPVTQTGFLAGVVYDAIDIVQTSSTVDTYIYKLGGISGTTVKTITVTYTSAAKTDLDTVVAT